MREDYFDPYDMYVAWWGDPYDIIDEQSRTLISPRGSVYMHTVYFYSDRTSWGQYQKLPDCVESAPYGHPRAWHPDDIPF